MITSRMQLNALIRNKAAGDGDKAIRRQETGIRRRSCCASI